MYEAESAPPAQFAPQLDSGANLDAANGAFGHYAETDPIHLGGPKPLPAGCTARPGGRIVCTSDADIPKPEQTFGQKLKLGVERVWSSVSRALGPTPEERARDQANQPNGAIGVRG